MVDTGAWYALADSSDAHHRRAKSFYVERTVADLLVTTNLVLAETWSLLSSHLGRHLALEFWRSLRKMGLDVWTVESLDMDAAWHALQAFPDQNFSLVDGTTFAVMERRGLTDVFAFDSHFLVYRYGPQRREAFRRHP